MKLKSLSMLLLFAISWCYISPAIADESNQNNQQQPIAQSSSSSANGVDNAYGSVDPSQDPSQDQGVPDTATGDDDF